MGITDEIFTVGVVNAANLLDAFESFESVEDFMYADIHVGLHATTISNAPQCLKFHFDIDGLVLELERLQGLQGGLHFLSLPRFKAEMMKPHYHFLKKHVDLTSYSSNGLMALKNTVGHKIGNVDGGYHLILSAVPSTSTEPDTRLFRKELYNVMAAALLDEVTCGFQGLLRSAPKTEKARPTYQKQGSRDTSQYHILRQDLNYILSLLDEAITKANECHYLKVVAFMNQFGQKDPEPLDIADFINPADVRALSIHVACNLTASDPDSHILFSRCGMQDLVGVKGTLFSVLGMHEATNFQSKLGNMATDVSKEVLDVLWKEGKRTFLQMYVDSPHAYVQMPYKHPVSGNIVTCGLSHPNFHSALLSRGARYLGHMRDLKERLVCPLGCRIEQVLRFDEHIPMGFDAASFFDLQALQCLLRDHPLILPFKNTASGRGLLSTLDSTLGFLLDTLSHLYWSSQGVADYEASWKTFQIELALEELFHGRPLSPLDFHLSVSLGTSTVGDKSLTHSRGFIGLAPFSSASEGETPPPLHHWTRDALQKNRIERLFPLCQTLCAEPSVIGPALVRVLLGDIYRTNTGIPMAALCSDSPPGRLTGALSLESFSKDLSTQNSFPVPNTFGRARTLVEQAGKDVEQCIMKGFLEEKLVFFPAIQFRDFKGSRRMWWNGRDYIQVHPADQEPLPLSQVAAATLQACAEIEMRGLAYSSSLEKYREHGMVWMPKVQERLPVALKGNIRLNVMTFISCVAMIMNGDYVDYSHLRTLLSQISFVMDQPKLQKLQILSKFAFPKVYNMVIFKLHESIPFRSPQKPRLQSAKKPRMDETEEQRGQPEEDVQAVSDDDDTQSVVRSPAMCMPANTKKAWSEIELSLINRERQVTNKVAYDEYVRKCHEKKIPVRTLEGFRRRRQRLLS